MFETKSPFEDTLRKDINNLCALLEARNLKEISDDYAHSNGSYRRYTNEIKDVRDKLVDTLRRVS